MFKLSIDVTLLWFTLLCFRLMQRVHLFIPKILTLIYKGFYWNEISESTFSSLTLVFSVIVLWGLWAHCYCDTSVLSINHTIQYFVFRKLSSREDLQSWSVFYNVLFNVMWSFLVCICNCQYLFQNNVLIYNISIPASRIVFSPYIQDWKLEIGP